MLSRTSRFREADERATSTIKLLLPHVLGTEQCRTSIPTARAKDMSVSSADDDDTVRPSRISVSRTSRLGTRSCEGCHQRKVRCDRGVPCTNCSKHRMTCLYPTQDPDTARQPPTLRNISNRLKRLEILLSRFAKSSEITTGSAVDNGGCHGGDHPECEIHILARPGAVVNAIKSASQHSSDRPPNKSTWDILLNNSDIDPLLQDVRPDFFLRLFGLTFLPLRRDNT